MAYKSWKGKSQSGEASDASAPGSSDFQVDLGSKKKVTVRKFGKVNLIDIREFYEKDGVLLPGKKGISLTEEVWEKLLESRADINKALKKLDDDAQPKRKIEEDDEDQEEDAESKSKTHKKIKTED